MHVNVLICFCANVFLWLCLLFVHGLYRSANMYTVCMCMSICTYASLHVNFSPVTPLPEYSMILVFHDRDHACKMCSGGLWQCKYPRIAAYAFGIMINSF